MGGWRKDSTGKEVNRTSVELDDKGNIVSRTSTNVMKDSTKTEIFTFTYDRFDDQGTGRRGPGMKKGNLQRSRKELSLIIKNDPVNYMDKPCFRRAFFIFSTKPPFMFQNAIENVGRYTRPIHFISNAYGEKDVRPGAATLFFVNDEGVAVTCKHISAILQQSGELSTRYTAFLAEKSQMVKSGTYNKRIRELKTRYGFDQPDATCQLMYQFVDCVDFTSVDVIDHPVYDLAILKMKGYSRSYYTGHAVFAKDSSGLQPGLFLCRLGFPFPEFSNFSYQDASESITWTSDPVRTVRFPIEGMVTRHLAEADGSIMGIEISTPGLRGQSGGPLFDTNGIVYGMQSRTNHLHLGFDMKNSELVSEGKKLRVTNQPFLHVGACVHVDRIKEFLRQHSINFFEA